MPTADAHELENCARVLVVEGYGDLLFYAEVLESIGNYGGVFIKEMKGKKRMRTSLTTFLRPDLLKAKTSIGVIVDADTDAPGTAQSFEAQLHAITGQRAKNGDWTAGPPRIGLLVVPGGGKEGEIESLVWEAWSNDPANVGAKACVEAFIGCMAGHELRAKSPDKGRINAILSVVSDEDPRLGPGARDQVFDFKRPEFQPLIGFLRQL